jgi:hypothetical protein
MQFETSTVTDADITKRLIGVTLTALAKPNVARDALAALTLPNSPRHQLQPTEAPLTRSPIHSASLLIPALTQPEVHLDPHTAFATFEKHHELVVYECNSVFGALGA